MEPQKLQQLKKEFGDRKEYLETDEVAKVMNKRYEVHWDRGRAYTRLTHLRDFFEIGEKEDTKEGRWKIKFPDLAYFARVIQHENEVKIQEACKRVWKEEKALQEKDLESTTSGYNQEAHSITSVRVKKKLLSKMENFIEKEQGLKNKSELIRKSIENYIKSLKENSRSEKPGKSIQGMYTKRKDLKDPKSNKKEQQEELSKNPLI